jgi:4-oxalocrotonate tautomerase
MPMINVKMFSGRTAEQKAALVEELTSAIVRTCGAERDDVWIIIDDVTRENWSLAGKLYSES